MPQPFPAVLQFRSARSARTASRGRIVRSVAVCASLMGLAIVPAAQADAAAGGAEAGAAPASSAAAPRAAQPAAASSRRTLVIAVQRRLHLKADGAYGSRSRAAVRRFQARHRLRVTGRLDRATLSVLGVTAVATSVTAPSAGAAAVLASIARCESGGDPTRVSPDGKYHGKYQFDTGTWHAIGGSGDADAASEAEQDQRAAALYAKRGTDPWPTCGPQATASR